MGQKHAVMDDQFGCLIYFDDEYDPVPAKYVGKAIPITHDEWQMSLATAGHTITADGKLKAPEPESAQVVAGRVAVNRMNLVLQAGLTITSTSTPAVSGLYRVDDHAQHKISATMLYIAQYGKFPGKTGTLTWLDYRDAAHVFTSVALFSAFAVAVMDYVADLTHVAHNAPGSKLPPATVTIV